MFVSHWVWGQREVAEYSQFNVGAIEHYESGLDVRRFGRYALTVAAAGALLAGCGGSQPPIGAAGAISHD